jgi:hypothetical protein
MSLSGRAVFSGCGRYRWWLERIWRPSGRRLLFIGLNPSRADDRRDDPTLRRLMAFASAWGYGGLEVLNLFAMVSPSPAALSFAADPVGDRNQTWIRRRLRALDHAGCRLKPGAPAALIWLGWGNGGRRQGQDQRVLELLAERSNCLVCLGRTTSGAPRHPLYLPSASLLQPFGASCGHSFAVPAAPCPAPPVATPSICS